jgi:hypothetical protein
MSFIRDLVSIEESSVAVTRPAPNVGASGCPKTNGVVLWAIDLTGHKLVIAVLGVGPGTSTECNVEVDEAHAGLGAGLGSQQPT